MLLLITIIASTGFMFAIVSFITGIQILRGNTVTAKKMHRLNGYLTFAAFSILVLLVFIGKAAIIPWLFAALIAGAILSFAKIRVVKNKRFCKYASQVGFLLLITWVVILVQIIRHLS